MLHSGPECSERVSGLVVIWKNPTLDRILGICFFVGGGGGGCGRNKELPLADAPKFQLQLADCLESGFPLLSKIDISYLNKIKLLCGRFLSTKLTMVI